MQSIINAIGKHKISGNEIIFETCPFCKNGSGNDKYKFSLNKRSGLYFCQRGSCKAKGNLRQLAQKMNVRLFNDNFITTEKNFVKPSRKVNDPNKKLYDYFDKRGISEDSVDFANIQQDKDRIVFDYFDEQGNLTFRKYKTFIGKIISREKNTKPIFYMMNKVDNESETLIITEGEEDCLSLYEIGYNFAVSLPSGSSDMNCITYNWNWLQTFKTFIIWTDDDTAGHKAEQELIKRLGREKCKVVKHQENDINDTLVKRGRQTIVNIIESAEFLPISSVKGVYDYEIYSNNEEPRVKSSFDFINQKTEGGFRYGEVVIWTGYTSSGKSTILQQDLTSYINQGSKCCVYSAEMINERILRNFYRQCAGESKIFSKNSLYYDGKIYFVGHKNVDTINMWLNENIFFIVDTFDPEKSDLFGIFSQLIAQKGVDIFVIDNLMTIVNQNSEINHNQSEFIKKCMVFAKAHNVIIHVVAHQRKLSEEHNKRFRPTKGGISGSANLGNAVDIVIGIARIPFFIKSDEENKINYDGEIIMLKERATGNEGYKSPLWFNKKSLRFSEIEDNFELKLGWEAL